jgi:hypothetical protein
VYVVREQQRAFIRPPGGVVVDGARGGGGPGKDEKEKLLVAVAVGDRCDVVAPGSQHAVANRATADAVSILSMRRESRVPKRECSLR